MKKGDVAEFSAKWWRTSQPKDLSSAGKLDKALKAYESSQSKLKSAASPEAQKEALEALDDVETSVRSVIAEAKRVKGNPELALTADILGKMDFAAERKAAETAVKKGAGEDEDENEGGLSDPATFKLALRKGLRKLENGPLNFGFVAGKKAIHHRLVLSRTKGPQPLAAAAARELRLTRFTFGVARSSEERPDTILLYLDGKQLPGLAKKGTRMLKAFKPQPFGQIALFVAGNEVQDILDEADEDTDEADEDTDDAAEEGEPDWAALTAELTGLAKQIAGAAAGNAGRQKALVELAVTANAAVKARQDFAAAGAAVGALREALQGDGAGVGSGKTMEVWQTAKDAVDDQLRELSDELRESAVPELVDVAEEVETLLEPLRVKLAVALMDYDKTRGPATREKALSALTEASAWLASEGRVRAVDENPFEVTVTAAATLGAALRRLEGELAG